MRLLGSSLQIQSVFLNSFEQKENKSDNYNQFYSLFFVVFNNNNNNTFYLEAPFTSPTVTLQKNKAR